MPLSFNEINENSVEHAETVIKSNFYGAKLLTEALLPMFRLSHSKSRILNISSRLGSLNTLNRLQEIDDGCYSLFLKAASTCLDNDKNIKSENFNDVADLVNSSYSEAGLTAFGVKMIWVEFKEYWKAWNEVIKVVDQDIVDWQSGTIKPKDERDWEMILRAVPEAVAFKSKKLFLASEIHSIFTRSNVQDFEDLKHDMSINCPSTSHMP